MTLEEGKVFITAWHASASIAEVAQRTGLTKKQVNNRAAHLREKGVKLPTMRPNSSLLSRQDWDELRRLARNLADAKAADKYRKSS